MFVELGFKSIFRKLVITEMVSCKFQWWHTTAINGATFLVICHLMDKTESNNWSRLDLFFLLQKFIVLRNLVVSYYSLWRYHCGIILLDFFLLSWWYLMFWWHVFLKPNWLMVSTCWQICVMEVLENSKYLYSLIDCLFFLQHFLRGFQWYKVDTWK